MWGFEIPISLFTDVSDMAWANCSCICVYFRDSSDILTSNHILETDRLQNEVSQQTCYCT